MDLHEGETRIEAGDLSYTQTSRNWATSQLLLVARECEVGRYPHQVRAFDLGRALYRVLVNCNEPDAVMRLVAGLMHGARNRAEADAQLFKSREKSESKTDGSEGAPEFSVKRPAPWRQRAN